MTLLPFVVVATSVLANILTALITVERVRYPWFPAIATPLTHAGETAFPGTFLPSPRIGLPIEVVNLSSSYFTDEEPYLSTLIVLFFLGSYQLGQLTVWGVRDKQRNVMASTPKPITTL